MSVLFSSIKKTKKQYAAGGLRSPDLQMSQSPNAMKNVLINPMSLAP